MLDCLRNVPHTISRNLYRILARQQIQRHPENNFAILVVCLICNVGDMSRVVYFDVDFVCLVKILARQLNVDLLLVDIVIFCDVQACNGRRVHDVNRN